MGQRCLVVGKRVSMRLWVDEPGSKLKAHRGDRHRPRFMVAIRQSEPRLRSGPDIDAPEMPWQTASVAYILRPQGLGSILGLETGVPR